MYHPRPRGGWLVLITRHLIIKLHRTTAPAPPPPHHRPCTTAPAPPPPTPRHPTHRPLDELHAGSRPHLLYSGLSALRHLRSLHLATPAGLHFLPLLAPALEQLVIRRPAAAAPRHYVSVGVSGVLQGLAALTRLTSLSLEGHEVCHCCRKAPQVGAGWWWWGRGGHARWGCLLALASGSALAQVPAHMPPGRQGQHPPPAHPTHTLCIHCAQRSAAT